jgi:hypothetical protein
MPVPEQDRGSSLPRWAVPVLVSVVLLAGAVFFRRGSSPPPVTVAVTPATVDLGPSQSAKLEPQVSGGNKAVTWTVSPSLGSITPAGVYTAPETIVDSQAVRVTATSLADPTKSASVAVNLKAPDAPAVVGKETPFKVDPGKTKKADARPPIDPGAGSKRVKDAPVVVPVASDNGGSRCRPSFELKVMVRDSHGGFHTVPAQYRLDDPVIGHPSGGDLMASAEASCTPIPAGSEPMVQWFFKDPSGRWIDLPAKPGTAFLGMRDPAMVASSYKVALLVGGQTRSTFEFEFQK